MAKTNRKLTVATATTLLLLAGAVHPARACDQDKPDTAAKLTADVDQAAGAQKLQQIKDEVLALAQSSGWIHRGWTMSLSVPGVNEFTAKAKDGTGVLELFGSSRPTTVAAKVRGALKPNRFQEFRLFVRVKPDGTLDRDVYGRPQVDRFESISRYFRVKHDLANAKDVAKDVMRNPETFKGLVMSGLAVVTHVASAGTFTTALSAVLGWKGLETITKAIAQVRQQRASVLEATVKAITKEADSKHPPTYQQAYQLYLSNMRKANLSGMMGVTDFIRELNDAGIALE